MIRAVATKKDGTKMLFLGVDDENIRRLTHGEPLTCAGESVGNLGVDVVVIHGKTLKDVLRWFEEAGLEVPGEIAAELEAGATALEGRGHVVRKP